MTDKKFDLSRRKVLGSIGLIGAGSAVAGAGTMAYFSDTEESTGNTVSAGTLDLKVNGNDIQDGASVNIGPLVPGDSESYSLNLGVEGDTGGDLYLKFDSGGALEDDLDLSWDVAGGNSGDVNLENTPTGWISTNRGIDPEDDPVSGTFTATLPESVGNEAQEEEVDIDVAMKIVQYGGSP
ncbi:hypothetical protein A6E15_12965 [Natrinema saccharevitans]|uniref:SipW-cognate class signal peptide n=1 Tax=Natrinema saccharevitans TaxID=301967 RepID=A0A1S8AYZ8_9EURY|nr:TasA family protein [Natrinema saccharevitans]OLZ41837.1 hypothetical protein A6E15_12965 [Natrinema saccharevitans]